MAKPIKGTKADDDLTLLGTPGNDTIQGKGGNDTIKGGMGNDKIDGGNGIDTAVYSGSMAQYTWTPLGTGNDKFIVKDNVANRDGTDELKKVEFLQFSDGIVDLQNGISWQYQVNAEADEKGQKPLTEDVINGSGVPATGYNLARNEDAGIELGMQVHFRQGATINATDANGYADGVLEFTVPAGPQTATTAPGFPPSANHAAWSFDYSVITGLNSETTNLSDFTFKFLVDVDPGAGTDYQEFTMGPGGTQSANVHWINQFGDLVVDDRGIAGEVAQNSRNMAFYDVDHVTPGTQRYSPTFGPGDFDIILQAFDPLNNLIAQNHILVHVI